MRLDRLFGSILDSNKDNPTPRNRLIFWVSLLLAALFLYLALRNLQWSTFFSILSKAQITYLPFFLLWGSLTYVLRAYRWRILLKAEKLIAASSVFLANMAGYLGNAVLPARTGELVRAAYIAKKQNIHTSFALATGLTERAMDVVALVILGSLALPAAGLISPTLEKSLNVMGLVGVSGLAVVLALPRSAKLIEKLVDRLSVLPARQTEKVHSVIQSFLTGLASLSASKSAVFFTGFTGLIWLADAIGMRLLSHVLHLPLTLPQAFVLLAALGLSSAIPSTPGYVGVYQFAAVLALTPFGFSEAEAVALVLFSQIMNLVVVGAWGLIAIGRFSKTAMEPHG